VTVSVDAVEFLQPVEVGELVSLLGSVNYVGTKSLVVGIKVVAENIHTGAHRHTNTCYFTMVAKDANGATATIPPLILETEEDVRRYCAALQRKRLRDHARNYMNDYKSNFVVDDDVQKFLEKQRCEVALF
jgi:acyl-CoA hydrolase